MLFEHPGDQLSSDEFDSDKVYELMKQSADALSFIQSVGMDWSVSVDNAFFDKTMNVLKMIKGQTKSDDSLMPPEVLRGEARSSAVDVYCWAMSLCSMILNKTEEGFKCKANNKESHDKFIDSLKTDMRGLKGDERKKNVVIEEIVRALNYNPHDRPSFTQIRNRLKEFSGDDSLETKHKQKLIELLALKDKVKNSCVIEANEAEVNNLMNLGNSMLKYLKDKKREHEIISKSLVTNRKLSERNQIKL
jgi:serine/threonine protein kinase